MSVVISEKDFRDQVIRLATTLGWKVMSQENSTRVIRARGGYVRVRNVNPGGVGWPDLVMVRGSRMIAAELKKDLGPRGGSAHRDTTPEQDEWLNALYAAGASTFVWRPAQLQAIVEELGRGGSLGSL